MPRPDSPTEQTSRNRESFLGQAWLILTLALLFGAALAGVQIGLSERIESNKRAEALSQIPALLLGSDTVRGASIVILEDSIELQRVDGPTVRLGIVEREIGGHRTFEVRGEDDHLAGWVAYGSGQGYADVIELLVGLDPDLSRITGLFVLAQKETPALGDGITKAWFRERFLGKPTDRPLAVAKSAAETERDPTRIRAITAATISSRSVCQIVNRTIAEVRQARHESGESE